MVLHYSVRHGMKSGSLAQHDDVEKAERKRRALAAFDSTRGMMKENIAAFGGTEAFMRWVRSDGDEA